LGLDLISAPDLKRELPQGRQFIAPRPLRLLAIGGAAFAEKIGRGLGGRTHAHIAAHQPEDIPPYLANSFELALVDCTTRDSTLAAAIDRLHAASLPWVGAVPELDGRARAWLLDRGAADYIIDTGDSGGTRIAAAITGFAANRRAAGLVIADGPETRERLSAALTALGFGTVHRRSGDSGKDAVYLSNGTKLVLFGPDLGLAKTLEWLERFQNPAIGDIPAIVLAPAPFSGDVAAVLIKHGAFDVLPPPYAPELLALRVNLAMRTPHLEAILRETAARDGSAGAP
jgi:hypothetical protein